MSKVPSSLNVKFVISDLTLEIPKSFFDSAGLKVAVFVGRKGKGALTRRSKWYTVADASHLPTSTRAITVLDESDKKDKGAAAKVGEEPKTKEITGEMVVLKYGGLNDVEYNVEMHPINKFDGEWVFNPKTGHPLMVFAKVVAKYRPGVKVNIAATERDSNFNEMAGIDDADSEDDFSGEESINPEAEESHLNVSEMVNLGLTLEQMQSLTGEERSENEVLTEQLVREVAPLTRRYMAFPKMLDLSDVVNTKTKVASFSERMNCKAADMLGTTLSFNLKAIVPKDEMTEYEAKSKEKEDKEARKRREKEEKLLEKERKKQEKEDKKKNKAGKTDAYGAEANEGAGQMAETKENPHTEEKQKGDKKTDVGSLIKGIFSSKKEIKSQVTPFPLKCTSCPVPYLIYLDNFELKKLRMAPEYYRAVHIRLGSDANSLDTYPLLLLDASNPDFARKEDYISFDGTLKTRFTINFGDSHIFFGHKHIRNVVGFDTICALVASEKNYFERKKHEEAGESPEAAAQANPFQTEMLDVGEKFIPFAAEPRKYSTNGSQCETSKFTRVTASLIVPSKLVNVPIIDEQQEKQAYIKKLKKELKEKERIEKEKEAERKRELEKKKKESKGAVAAEGEEHRTESDVKEDSVRKPESEKKEEEEEKKGDEEEEEKPEEKEEQKEGEGEAGEGETKPAESDPAFQSGGADETAVVPETKVAAPKVSTSNRIIANASKSFQLPIYILNEEYTPAEGIKYIIRFKTGEELHFRARRLFLPAVSDKGHLAANAGDISLAKFEDEQSP